MAKRMSQQLQEKLRSVKSSSNPSPFTAQPKSSETHTESQEEVRLPTLEDLLADEDDRQTLAQIIESYGQMQTQKKILEAAMDPLNERIKTILGEYGIDKCRSGVFSVTLYSTNRSSLSKDLLLNHGISPQVIAASTVTTTSVSCRVSLIKEKGIIPD